jgi:hypothetical protein
MKRLLILLLLLLLFAQMRAQEPKISINAYLSGGMWFQNLARQYYTNDYQSIQQYYGLGGGVNLRIHGGLHFEPEVGLDCYGLKYLYGSTRDSRHLEADLQLLYTRVSPGFGLKLGSGFQIRAGLPLLISSGTSGSYRVRTFFPQIGDVVTGDYNDNFGRIRRRVIPGAEINLGYHAKLSPSWALLLRISGFIGLSPVMKTSLDTPHNPYIHRLSIDVGISRFSERAR